MNKPEVPTIPWRERAFVSLADASTIASVSRARLYDFEKAGRLEFRQFGGRTLVSVASLVALIDNAPQWTPSKRTESAVAARQERKRQAWREAQTVVEATE